MNIKEIRTTTGLTQKAFAELFDIPIGTLRRWEYGESTPAPYILKLIKRQLPIENYNMKQIKDDKGNIYYYCKDAGYLIDNKGTKISVHEDLEGVKEQNLVFYVQDLFEDYYAIVDKFEQDCRFDMKEDIIWS